MLGPHLHNQAEHARKQKSDTRGKQARRLPPLSVSCFRFLSAMCAISRVWLAASDQAFASRFRLAGSSSTLRLYYAINFKVALCGCGGGDGGSVHGCASDGQAGGGIVGIVGIIGAQTAQKLWTSYRCCSSDTTRTCHRVQTTTTHDTNTKSGFGEPCGLQYRQGSTNCTESAGRLIAHSRTGASPHFLASQGKPRRSN